MARKEGGKNLPSRRVFSILVGMMILTGLLFIIIFMASLAILIPRKTDMTSHDPSMHQREATRRAMLKKHPLLPDDGRRVNGVILILCRNRELAPLIATLRQFEERFNAKHQYPYLLLNNEPFSVDFEYSIRNVLSGKRVQFGQVPQEHWSPPPSLNMTRLAESRRNLAKVVHGTSLSYRLMCRYYAGFFQDHPLMSGYEWYWRVEPGVSFPCDIPEDPFRKMEREGRVYGFSIAMSEIMATIPSLWSVTKEYYKSRYSIKNSMEYFMDPSGNYNGCHFWNNFEIARLDFFRSTPYRQYFAALEAAGGFFYERWGDAPIHSLAAGMLLKPEQIVQFGEIGYQHDDSSFCPADPQVRSRLLCDCSPYEASDAGNNYCMTRWSQYRNDAE